MQVNKRTRLFGLFRIQYTLFDFQGYSLASQLPLDSGSGGIISLASYAQQVGGATSALPPGIIKQQQFCFVPTYSALNITPGGSAALRAQYSPGTNVGTPFANFRTAGRENEQHIEYTMLNSNWMLRELRQNPLVLNCAAFCQATPAISGSSSICLGTTQSYTVNAPASTTVQWDVQPAGLVSYTLSSNTISITNSNSASDHLTLVASISGECGQFAIAPFPITLGTPTLTELVGLTTIPCGDPQETYRITPFSSNLTYSNLSVTGAGSRKSTGYASSGQFAVVVRGTGNIHITVDIAGPCGTDQAVLDVYAEGVSCRPSGRSTAALYPNPARETVDVHTENASPAHPVTVRLFDGYGQPRAEQTSTGAEAVRLRTDQLPAGLYFVHILRGPEVLSRQQLRIEK